MLRELHISGLGVIDDLDLELDPGLNVLTGETGAGKTMVTVGLALALGQRGASSLIRPGARAARVQARFDGPLPASAGEWVEDGELVLARSIGADGKSSVRIGGQIATVAALAAIGPELIEVHGQHSGLGLLRPAAHVAFLRKYYAAGNFLRSGRKIPREGGIIIAAGDDRTQIETIIREDPFHARGLAEFRVIQFRASQRADDINVGMDR